MRAAPLGKLMDNKSKVLQQILQQIERTEFASRLAVLLQPIVGELVDHLTYDIHHCLPST